MAALGMSWFLVSEGREAWRDGGEANGASGTAGPEPDRDV